MRRSLDIGEEVGANEKGANQKETDLIPTGSTLLNLALSDNPYGGYAKGTIVNPIGDRSAGKTFLSWNIFAEMVSGDSFDEYSLYYDDAERRLRIAIKKMFGKRTKDRVQLEESDTIEDFYETVQGILRKKSPFVYVLDSFDSMSDRAERKKKELEKDYPVKTALFTEMLRKIAGGVRNTDSLIVILSQVRQTIGVVFGPSKRRTGGDALGHYASYEYWLAQRGLVLRKKKEMGTHTQLRVTKNSVTGKLRTVEFDILHDYGVHNIGSMVDWMVSEGFWQQEKGKQKLDTGDDYGSTTRERLIKKVDEEGREPELIGIVAECWAKVEREIATDLKPRYS